MIDLIEVFPEPDLPMSSTFFLFVLIFTKRYNQNSMPQALLLRLKPASSQFRSFMAPFPGRFIFEPRPLEGCLPMASLEELIAETQRVLQPLISKPQLKTNLLEKPPFRFVHDVVTAVTAATGFGDGLFADREELLDGKGIKEKQEKIDYLDRVILCVGHFHGRACEAKSAKIVAGESLPT